MAKEAEVNLAADLAREAAPDLVVLGRGARVPAEAAAQAEVAPVDQAVVLGRVAPQAQVLPALALVSALEPAARLRAAASKAKA